LPASVNFAFDIVKPTITGCLLLAYEKYSPFLIPFSFSLSAGSAGPERPLVSGKLA
jgi:hypothetical protein